MNGSYPRRIGESGLVRRFHVRLLAFAAIGVGAVAIIAGFALADSHTTPIGSGVVVINTKLGYSNGAGAGTGIVLTSSGEILTNNHVIDGATTIKIVVPGTGHRYTARVVGYSVSADVAVLQASGASNLKTVSPGNSSTVKLGQAVTAIGNANGTGTLTSTSGEVTGVSQAITVSDDQAGSEHLSGLIETNTTLEPGDSGGPLLNSSGKVIGMNAAASVGYGFRQMASSDSYAIPINTVLAIEQQIEAGKASATVHIGKTAFLGVSVTANGFATTGATIEGVLSGGPASDAGLTAGDTITALDGHTISSPTTLETVLLQEKPGARVSITYVDEYGTSAKTTATLTSGPPQ